jgi:hypothetical protein
LNIDEFIVGLSHHEHAGNKSKQGWSEYMRKCNALKETKVSGILRIFIPIYCFISLKKNEWP